MTSKPSFPTMSHKVGDHVKQSVSVRSEGFSQPHARSPDRNLAASLYTSGTPHQLPGTTSPILPAQVAAMVMPVLYPSFPFSPLGQDLGFTAKKSLSPSTQCCRQIRPMVTGGWGWMETDLRGLRKARRHSRKELNQERGGRKRDTGENVVGFAELSVFPECGTCSPQGG